MKTFEQIVKDSEQGLNGSEWQLSFIQSMEEVVSEIDAGSSFAEAMTGFGLDFIHNEAELRDCLIRTRKDYLHIIR